jgi:hypothetical protein
VVVFHNGEILLLYFFFLTDCQMWEMLYPSDFPYNDALAKLKWMSLVGDAIVSGGLRPTLNVDSSEVQACPAGFIPLMQRSWATEPWLRPSFVEIALALRQMLVLSADGKLELDLSHICSLSLRDRFCGRLIVAFDHIVVGVTDEHALSCTNVLNGQANLLKNMSSSKRLALRASANEDELWICDGSDVVTVLQKGCEQGLPFEGSLDTLSDIVFVNDIAYAVGSLRGKLALGEWAVNACTRTMVKLAVLHQELSDADVIEALVVKGTPRVWLLTKSTVLIVDTLRMATFSCVECKEQVKALFDVDCLEQVWGLTDSELVAWDQEGNLLSTRILTTTGSVVAGLFVHKYNVLCVLNDQKELFVYIVKNDLHLLMQCYLPTRIAMSTLSMIDVIQDVDGYAAEFDDYCQGKEQSHFVDFLRFMAQLRAHWDPNLAKRVLGDFLEPLSAKSVLPATSHDPRKFSRDDLTAIETDVRNWVEGNVLQKFLLAKKKKPTSEVQWRNISMTFVDKSDLLLIADSRLHFFHLGPVVEQQVVRQAPMTRVKSALEAELENSHQLTKEIVQKRITVMMNTAHIDEGRAVSAEGAPIRERGRAFVMPRKI